MKQPESPRRKSACRARSVPQGRAETVPEVPIGGTRYRDAVTRRRMSMDRSTSALYASDSSTSGPVRACRSGTAG